MGKRVLEVGHWSSGSGRADHGLSGLASFGICNDNVFGAASEILIQWLTDAYIRQGIAPCLVAGYDVDGNAFGTGTFSTADDYIE